MCDGKGQRSTVGHGIGRAIGVFFTATEDFPIKMSVLILLCISPLIGKDIILVLKINENQDSLLVIVESKDIMTSSLFLIKLVTITLVFIGLFQTYVSF